jgi:hypothetical protein
MSRYRGGSTRTRVLLAALAMVSLVAIFTMRVSRKMPDFEVYWTAGSRAIAAEPLYRAGDGHFQFKYLPAFALFAAPFAMIPLAVAKGVWFALSAVLMVALLWLSAVALPRPKRPLALLVVVTFVAMSKFYAHELVLGQVNFLFAVIVMLAVVGLERGHEMGAGVLLALAVIVKPYAAIFAPWLAVRPRRTAFLAMIAAVAVLLLLPALRYGWRPNLHLLGDWWNTVRTSTAPNLANQDNVSLAAMFTKWLGPDSAAPTLTLLTVALLVGLTAVVVAGRTGLVSPEPLEAALLLTLIPLVSPQGWDYVFLIATPAVMLIVDNLGALPRGLRLASAAAIAVAGLTIYDLIGRDAYAAFMAASVITICFLIEVAALITLRFRRSA